MASTLSTDQSSSWERGMWSLKHYLRSVWSIVGKDYQTLVGMVLVLLVLVLAAIGPLISPYDPNAVGAGNTLAAPSRDHIFGTDEFGRDVFSRTLAGFRIDISVAIISVAAAFILGTVIGALSGYYGGVFDDTVMRIIDVIQSFPMLVLAMGMAAFLGVGMTNVILITAAINVPIFARLMRGEILYRKSLDYVDAAICSGNSGLRIAFYHLYPNCSGPVIVQAALNLAWAVLNVAALSFLGIGVQPPTPEWGIMVAEGSRYMSSGAWWISIFPGASIMLSVLAFNILGDGMQDVLDPRRRT